MTDNVLRIGCHPRPGSGKRWRAWCAGASGCDSRSARNRPWDESLTGMPGPLGRRHSTRDTHRPGWDSLRARTRLIACRVVKARREPSRMDPRWIERTSGPIHYGQVTEGSQPERIVPGYGLSCAGTPGQRRVVYRGFQGRNISNRWSASGRRTKGSSRSLFDEKTGNS